MTTTKKTIIDRLSEIQKELKAPKGQYNAFGKYNYRSCEDILEAVKPLLGDLILTLSDEIVFVGDRYYIKSTARLFDGTNFVETTAFAREALTKKGMDEAQITGSASSYSRKYALNGMFCIDENKDPDATNKHEKEPKKEEPKVDSPITEKQLTTLAEHIMAAEADEAKFCEHFKIENISLLPQSKYKTAVTMLKQKQKGKK